VYFDAAWADTFLHESTNDGTFRLAAGDTIVTKFMHKTDSCSYSEDQNFQALELPYDGRQVSMVILLPKAASGVTSASIDYQEVVGLVAGMSRNLVDVSLPKFSFTYGTCDLQLPLKNMGMLRAFGVGTPDFSGIDGDYDLVISKVLHQAYVCVDEKGTTAAAATAVVMIGTTYSPILTSNRKIFTADHPFVFLIRDVPTGQILFLGYMANPAGTN
jgi:serpin B